MEHDLQLSCPSGSLTSIAPAEKPVKNRCAQTVYGYRSRWRSLRSAAANGEFVLNIETSKPLCPFLRRGTTDAT